MAVSHIEKNCIVKTVICGILEVALCITITKAKPCLSKQSFLNLFCHSMNRIASYLLNKRKIIHDRYVFS